MIRTTVISAVVLVCSSIALAQKNPTLGPGPDLTGDVWKGKLHSVSTDVGHGGQCSNETWDGEFSVVVGGNGEVQGKGSGHLVAPPNCSGNLAFTGCPSKQATQVDFEVYGTFDGKQFQLAFSETRINGSTCGLSNYTIWLDPRYGAKSRSPSGFTVPVIAPGDAEGQVSNSASGGNGQHTLTLKRDCGDKDVRKQHPRRSSGNCKPDRAKGCKDLEETKIAFANIIFQALQPNDYFSDKTMEKAKGTLDPWIDTLRADFCDNSSALETLDKLSDELSGLLCEDSLDRHRSIIYFEQRLNLMRRDVCGWRP